LTGARKEASPWHSHNLLYNYAAFGTFLQSLSQSNVMNLPCERDNERQNMTGFFCHAMQTEAQDIKNCTYAISAVLH